MTTNRILLSTRKGLVVLRRDTDWGMERHEFAGVGVSSAVVDPRTGLWWVGQKHGHFGPKLLHSHDEGATWHDHSTVTYPQGATRPDGTPAALTEIFTIQPGLASQPDRMWIGTLPGGLFRSDDGGKTFEFVQSFWDQDHRPLWFGAGTDDPALHSICVDPRDPRTVRVASSVAGVFVTHDDGDTWETITNGMDAEYMPDPTVNVPQDPHSLVQSPTNPDVLWSQHHCGIYKSIDAGLKWECVSQPDGPDRFAHFGFPVAVADDDPDTAWVVPAQADDNRSSVNLAMSVARTTDGGRTWQSLTKGLPQSGSFDVVYRHALAYEGNSLAFGSTTGNAYVSDDRGDSWTCLGTGFPPIYAVSFA